MAKVINRDIAFKFTGHCAAAVLVVAWRHGSVAESLGSGGGGDGGGGWALH
jgi:hypothetical protein